MTNPHKLSSSFKSIYHSDVSEQTIANYISYLEDAFVLCRANRYNVKGRKYIGTPNKFYFEDVGLRNARLNFRQMEENHIMENVIFNELRYRGFNVDVGVVEKRSTTERTYYEIDFVANKGSQRYYIQSAFEMSDAETGTGNKIARKRIRRIQEDYCGERRHKILLRRKGHIDHRAV